MRPPATAASKNTAPLIFLLKRTQAVIEIMTARSFQHHMSVSIVATVFTENRVAVTYNSVVFFPF
jgi:hypothetical protein